MKSFAFRPAAVLGNGFVYFGHEADGLGEKGSAGFRHAKSFGSSLIFYESHPHPEHVVFFP